MHFLFQPNAPEIFFWTLSIYFLVRFIKNKERKFLFVFVISISLSWWSKYSVAFLAAAIFIAFTIVSISFYFFEKANLCCPIAWIDSYPAEPCVAILSQLAIRSITCRNYRKGSYNF
jgi:hypothetical protein